MALPGTYDFARDAWFKGIGAVGKSLGPGDRASSPAQPQRPRSASRNGLRRHIAPRLPASSAGIAIAFATGDQNAVDQDDADAMRRSGLTHLLSVSGLHIAAVVAFAMLLTLQAAGAERDGWRCASTWCWSRPASRRLPASATPC